MITALYPGTFDPLHNGHLDIIQRAARIFDRLLVTVLKNPTKAPWFTGEERADLIRAVTRDLSNVEVSVFEGLTVSHAKSAGADIIVRGLRAVMDYDYEVQMALMNRQMAPDIETLFMLTAAPCAHISSSLVKQVALFGVPLEGLVPEPVAEAMRHRRAEREL